MAPIDTAAFGNGLAVESRFLAHSWPKFLNLCQEQGLEFVDIRDNVQLRAAGYDFETKIAALKGAYPVFSELKVDQYLTGNLVAEVLSLCFERPAEITPGWTHTSRADWLLYAFSTTEEVLLVPMRAFREYVFKRASELSSCSKKNPRKAGGSYASLSLLVPVRAVLRNVPGAIFVKLDPANFQSVLNPQPRGVPPHPSHLPQYHTPAQFSRIFKSTLNGVYLSSSADSFAPAMCAEAVSRQQFSSEAGQKKLSQNLEQLLKKLLKKDEHLPYLEQGIAHHQAYLRDIAQPIRLCA